jgi:hypothetical protein
VGPGGGQLAQGLTGQRDDLMPLFGGKTSGAGRSVARPGAPPAGRGQSEPANGGPTCDRVPPAAQSRRRLRPRRRAARREPAWLSTDRSGPPVGAPSAPDARGGRVVVAAPMAVWSSWPAGYLTAELPWGRTFGTRY